MGVAVKFSCNGAGDGLSCPSYVAIALSAFDDTVMIDAAAGLWLVESEWKAIPEGWRVEADGTAFCPEHAVMRPALGVPWVVGQRLVLGRETAYVVAVPPRSKQGYVWLRAAGGPTVELTPEQIAALGWIRDRRRG